MPHPHVATLVLSALLVLSATGPARAQTAYVHFESPQVHPARLTPNGTRLLVANTADARLSVFDISVPAAPVRIQEIPVGLEPVSVSARTDDEVWVVNAASDNISIVSLSQGLVLDTLVTGDEPADVVFAGSPQRAFVSVARKNEVRVYDPVTKALVKTIALTGEQPRALAVNASGTTVYAAFAMSGNRTTIIPENLAPPQPAPTNQSLPAPPKTGLIVDATNPSWSSVIRYTMPDNDVVEINANTQAVVRYFSRVGTVNLGLAVQPTTGSLYVVNTDALNLVRYEPNLRGHFVDNRVTRITTTGTITPVDLNPGINYSVLPNTAALSTALAQPTDIVFEAAGTHAWVAAFGTDRVARIDANGVVVSRVEVGPSSGSSVNPRTKRGPRGLALHGASGTLYVVNRISNTLSVVNTATSAVVSELNVGAVDPTPTVIREGRGFLYDAKLSGNGTASCAACHVDAELDMLAWDLGNPGGNMQTVTDPVTGSFNMHPMKGPMITQTLKGLTNTEPLHWRGDKATFNDFNGAFSALMGGSTLSTGDMQSFTDFIHTLRLPPNPNRNLNDTLPTSLAGGNPQAGENTFLNEPFNGSLTCNTCHTLTNGGTNRTIIPAAAIQEPQPMKSAQLRNIYQRNNFRKTVGVSTVTGFGFTHDGVFATVDEFLSMPVFGSLRTDPVRRSNLNAFLLAFPTGTAPAVGYSRTVTSSNATNPAVTSDVSVLEAQAIARKIDLIGKGKVNGVVRGFYYNPITKVYDMDSTSVASMTWAQLQSSAVSGSSHFTLMGVPPNTGVRMGIDRDADGILDANE